MFTFLLGIFITSAYIIIHNKDIKSLLKVMITFIPALMFFIQYVITMLSSSSHEGTLIRYLSPYFILQEFILRFVYSYSKIEVLIFIIPLCFIGCLIIKKLLRLRDEYFVPDEILKDKTNRLLHNETMLALTGLLCALYFILPYEIFGWPKFNIRLLPFIFIFMLICAEPFSKRLIQRIFLGVVLIMSICLYGLMTYNITKINRELKDYISGIPVIEKNKCLLPVHLERYKVGQIRPLTWVFNYYNIFKGGATGKSVVRCHGRTPLKYKQPVEKTFPWFNPQKAEEADMKRIKQVYDYVIFWGRDQKAFKLFEDKGFVLIHSQGKLWVYKNERKAEHNNS
jgi:hypothetical protein